jgi:hypothetical protein
MYRGRRDLANLTTFEAQKNENSDGSWEVFDAAVRVL